MKAPDKIYLQDYDTPEYGLSVGWTTEQEENDAVHNIEYIQKDALLEWIKANLQDRDNWNEKSAADAFCETIDKINEM